MTWPVASNLGGAFLRACASPNTPMPKASNQLSRAARENIFTDVFTATSLERLFPFLDDELRLLAHQLIGDLQLHVLGAHALFEVECRTALVIALIRALTG